MTPPAILPVVLLLPFVLILAVWRRQIPNPGDRFLTASILWGSYAVAMTESLSFCNAITPAWFLGGWIVASLAVVAAARCLPRSPTERESTGEPAGAESYVFVPQIVVLAAILGIAAWVGPPNNWDSMAYHLSRVVHWIQNRNVAFYPTASLRQLELTPGAEYLILNVQILSGGDHWSNLVQWFAYAGSTVGVWHIARSLGGGPLARVLAATYAATLPMACLQSGTTQNDMVAAFWLVCFIAMLLRLGTASRRGADWGSVLLCGMSLGLAVLTKSTMYLLAAPFGAGLAFILFRRGLRTAFAKFAVITLVVLAMNLPSLYRNWKFSGNPIGNGGFERPGRYSNVRPGFAAMGSNILRNASLELAADPLVPSVELEHAVRTVHRWCGLDPEDPGTTFFATPHYRLADLVWNSEDDASNPFHTVLLLAVLLTLLIGWRRSSGRLRWYAAGIAAAFMMFCGYLRYQPYHCRLHLPLLTASAALAGVVLEKHWRRGVAISVCSPLPLLVTPWILLNYLHPLVGSDSIFTVQRQKQYFKERDLSHEYQTIADTAAADHVKEVAVLGDGQSWEYPLAVMLHDRLPNVRIEAYPTEYLASPRALGTRNQGFDSGLTPYLVIDLTGQNAKVVARVTK